MAKAVVDPIELERFAHELRHFQTTMREQLQQLGRRFHRLSETWRDQEQERFGEEFTTMLQAVGRFDQLAEAQVPVLLRKAAAIRQYLERG